MEDDNQKPEDVTSEPEKIEETHTKQQLPAGVAKKRVFVIASIVLLVATIALGALWLTEKGKTKDLTDQLNQLMDNQLILEPTTDEESATKEIAEPENTCKGGSSYSAEIGKYTLELPPDFVIIKNIDGGFEGGPVTSLYVAKCNEEGINVVDNYVVNQIEIQTSKIYDPYQVEEGSTELDPLTIDGISAKVYSYNGLFTELSIVFEKGNKRTVIQATGVDNDAILDGPLKTVIDNFKFN